MLGRERVGEKNRHDSGKVASWTLFLVGGAPRVGKSSLARQLLVDDGIAWLPTDVIRTVLRQTLPDLDALDQDPVDAARLADYMYPHIQVAAEVCAEESERFLIEGFELAPWYRDRLRDDLDDVEVRACFLGHETFTALDLRGYRGPKPQHEAAMSASELETAAAWIRARSRQLRRECRETGGCYIDVSEIGFDAAMTRARDALMAASATEA